MDDSYSSDDDTSDLMLALCLQTDKLGIAIYDCLTTKLVVGQVYMHKGDVGTTLRNLKCQFEPRTIFVERKMMTNQNQQVSEALRRPAMSDPNEQDQELEDKKLVILPKCDFEVRTLLALPASLSPL
jgi:hypothetical protein